FFNHGFYTLIKMKSPAFKIEIDSSTFSNFKSFMSIVKNYRTYLQVINSSSSNTKNFAFLKDNYEFYLSPPSSLNCEYLENNPLLTSCKQIKISNCQFLNFESLYQNEIGDYSFTRGLIVDLYDF